MKVRLFFVLSFAALTLSGCLVYQKVSYEIFIDGEKSGEAKVTFYDLKSDALGNKEFNEDKENLFNKLLRSDEFIFSQKDEEKEVTSRRLFVEDKKLNGEVNFKFKDINVVEGIQQQDGYYFLTVENEDSIISTNGTVIPINKFKRIIWERNQKVLKFEMLTDVKLNDLRELAPFYKSNDN
ncbi:MAG: hypothetical protein COZ80_00335 [Ignavibacteria bacterium CG_4_8_14_3_um_filter_37_9]|nr:MAG: hypothetical protein COZ80_00335 [Ignavibacteria bacterium CG_4_8_14_3_um_filter_37_9]PIX93037.1 MAG: hypothetical protein COZ25_12730 [Ignavibacteria bacterium CG_4_10_14_3_um_filter_37_18]